ncbi:MAG: polymerase subunit gamma/tau, partial [Verrucomicrobiota bacterium]
KPEAVADDFNPELQTTLSTQAALIETDRLLELIDQFAGAEGRMKWAPNKKLHFEVAVIKAIQTLGQVTLNQVIENLSALRDGKTPITPVSTPPSGGHRAPLQQKTVAPKADLPPTPTDDSLDLDALWQNAMEQIRKRRPLIKGWIDSAKVLGTEGRAFLLGFPPDQKTAMESIALPRNREFLESILKEISGRDWTLKTTLKEGLVAEAPKEEAPQKKNDSRADFKDDPLIREALEIFKGEIKT